MQIWGFPEWRSWMSDWLLRLLLDWFSIWQKPILAGGSNHPWQQGLKEPPRFSFSLHVFLYEGSLRSLWAPLTPTSLTCCCWSGSWGSKHGCWPSNTCSIIRRQHRLLPGLLRSSGAQSWGQQLRPVRPKAAGLCGGLTLLSLCPTCSRLWGRRPFWAILGQNWAISRAKKQHCGKWQQTAAEMHNCYQAAQQPRFPQTRHLNGVLLVLQIFQSENVLLRWFVWTVGDDFSSKQKLDLC